MTAPEEILERAQRLIDEGRFMSGVQALEEVRLKTSDPSLQAIAAYNLGVTYWHRLGDGDAARREFKAVVAVFDEHGREKISRRMGDMLPNAVENAMLCALSFDEFEGLAARATALTPDSPIVTRLTPETLKARDEGQPWSDQLFKIAWNYYDRDDPKQDHGRYGEARSTYQLLLDHRRDLRLSRDRWRLATLELSALSLRMAADRMQADGGYRGQYSPEEFLSILADAVPFLDAFLAANPGDGELEKIRQDSDKFVRDIRDRWATQQVTQLNDEGLALLNSHDYDAARAKLAEAEKISRDIADPGLLQTCLGNLALVAKHTGDPDLALALLDEKEAICRAEAIPRGLAGALANRAVILSSLNKTKEAEASAKEAAELCHEHGLDDIGRQLGPLLEELRTRSARIEDGTTPRCYLCAEEGHFREMKLIPYGTPISMVTWPHPWSPTQGCFQCDACRRLTCYRHSEKANLCACGARSWREKQYLQLELDDGYE